MSRLTIDLTSQQYERLTALADLQGKAVKQYALERLFASEEDDDSAWEELKALLARRIDKALAGEISTHHVDDIVENELARGNRA